jgi:hypothetical protein
MEILKEFIGRNVKIYLENFEFFGKLDKIDNMFLCIINTNGSRSIISILEIIFIECNDTRGL